MSDIRLNCYYTLWGFDSAAVEAVQLAEKFSYQGIEGVAPIDERDRKEFGRAIEASGLRYIAEIATTGHYVPDRSLSLKDHLLDLNHQLENIAPLQPEFVTCLGGCDAWSKNESTDFFYSAIEASRKYDFEICFETHRGRSLFNPWITRDIVAEIPDIKLTFDISHWCVVCEGLQQTEIDLIDGITANSRHVHARVGYDQGPQVSSLEGVYQNELILHLKIWKQVWKNQIERGVKEITVTPEFGEDGYQYRDLGGLKSLVDVEAINFSMSKILKSEFANLLQSLEEGQLHDEQRAV